MLSGIHGQDGTFLSNLNAIESRISKNNQQITSGLRVREAADDPSAVAPILQYRAQIANLTQTQQNLTLATSDATAADSALQNAANILDHISTLGSEGLSLSSTAASRTTLGQQIQQLQEQLVSVANTSVRGNYIFGGDTPGTQPYTFNLTATDGVVSNSAAASTRVLSDGNGSTRSASLTAGQIIDDKDALGNPTASNIFAAVNNLGVALLANNDAGIQAAVSSLQTASSHLQSSNAFYGSVQNWIDTVNTSASSQLANLQGAASTLSDTDIATAITQMQSDQNALQASISAHASLSTKTLFDYLG